MFANTSFFEFFATFSGFVAGVVLVSQFIIRIAKVDKGWLKQLISWLLSIALAAVGFGFQLGYFADFGPINQWQGWVLTALNGVGAGLVANGIFDIDLVQDILNWIESLFKKKTKTETINE